MCTSKGQARMAFARVWMLTIKFRRRDKREWFGAEPCGKLELVANSAPLQRFQLFQRPWPIFSQQTGQAAVGQHLAFGLAASAVVGFVVRVTNPLDLFAASRTRLAVLPMYNHVFAESSHL